MVTAATDFAFLHGSGMGSWLWNKTIAALKAQAGGAANCFTLDVPGCGAKRGRDTSAVEFDDIALELSSDVETAGLRDVVLVGHSQAGSMMPRGRVREALGRRGYRDTETSAKTRRT